MATLQTVSREFSADAAVLNGLAPLMQWTADLAVNLMAAAPECKNRKGPWVGYLEIKLFLLAVRLMAIYYVSPRDVHVCHSTRFFASSLSIANETDN